MDRKELLSALSRLKVQTGSLACLGCGYEHQCSIKGCAIIRKATEELARYEQAFSIMAIEEFPDEVREILDNYYAEVAVQFIEQKKDALQDLDGWCESYQQENHLDYTSAEMAAWKAGMQFGNDTAHAYLSDLIESDPANMWEHET